MDPLRVTGPPRANGLLLYRGLITIAGIGVLALEVHRLPTTHPFGSEPWLFAAFAALLVLAETQSLPWIARVGGGEVTASGAFAFALLLIAPPAPGLVMLAFATAVSDMLQRKDLARTIFNPAQIIVSFSLGINAMRAIVDPLMLMHSSASVRWLAGAMVGGCVIFATNTLLTAIALALHLDRPLVGVLRSSLQPGLLIDGLLLAMAPILVAVARVSIVLEPLLIVTVWAIYCNAATSLRSRQEATHDLLTGLPNRRLFFEQAEEALKRAERRNRRAAMIHVDLDGFKAVNDGLGHHVGDLVLRAVAERLQHPRRSTDIVARLGGDEFAVLVPRIEDGVTAERIAARFREAISGPLEVGGIPISVGASLGVAMYPEHGADVDTLLRNADSAMYRAKRDPAGVQIYRAAPRERSTTRLDLLADLQRGIADGELITAFQPQADLKTGIITGVEALVRWRHPRLGVVMPEQFILAAEQTELVGPLTECVLDLALAQQALWRSLGIDLLMAVNASVRNLHDPTFVDTVAGLIDKYDADPNRLEIELTENCMLADPLRTEVVLSDLRRLGVRLALDDFGTGYSSLAILRTLPFDKIKIDRSFVAGLRDQVDDLTIVRSIIDLARNLGLGTVAEGVEDLETLELLRDLNCDAVQGFLIARPAPAGALVPLLEHGSITMLPIAAWANIPAPTR